MEKYLDGIRLNVLRMSEAGRADTVFWGGGTPGLLPKSAIEELGLMVQPYVKPHAEWSVELAPALVTPSKLRALRALGVNRASLGVQSLDADLLAKMGREHKPQQATRAFNQIRQAGFTSINIDMMFAIPGQSEDAWLKDLHAAIALEPDHISTYCLTFEEDTALWAKLQAGQFKRDIEQERALYLKTWHVLESAGYAQYEISNFARKGHACEHNINTWRMHSWIGLGPSAASQYAMARTTHVADLKSWHAGLLAGNPVFEDETPLDRDTLALDALIFGLRMNAGVDLAELEHRFDVPLKQNAMLEQVLSLLERENLLSRTADTLTLTLEGRLLADSIAGQLMDCF